MTEREIDAFLTIVRTGSISAAVQKLYVTQPALSRRIRALEQELGYGLMIRRKGVRNIELTAEGKAFIPLAEKWKSVWNESRDLKEIDRSRTFHIGSVGSVRARIARAKAAHRLQGIPCGGAPTSPNKIHDRCHAAGVDFSSAGLPAI